MTNENQADQKEQASQDDNIVNIRCDDIRLISSSLKFMEEATEETAGLGCLQKICGLLPAYIHSRRSNNIFYIVEASFPYSGL